MLMLFETSTLFNSIKGRRGGGHPAAGEGPTPGRRRGRSLRISSKFFFSFLFLHSDLLISEVYDFPREAAKSDDVCLLSSSERNEVRPLFLTFGVGT